MEGGGGERGWGGVGWGLQRRDSTYSITLVGPTIYDDFSKWREIQDGMLIDQPRMKIRARVTIKLIHLANGFIQI